MTLGFQITLIFLFLVIAFQDIKARQVYWFLFPFVGVLSGILYFNNTLPELFFNTVILNLCFVFILLVAMLSYTRMKLKAGFFKAIGLGDILLFLGLSFSFSTISFLVLFIGSLCFSLVMHLVFRKKSALATIPLAGYMGIFFSLTYIAFWSGFIHDLYSI